ncbi:2-deoxyglucose-6-phosphate phosphatase [Vibrio mediterranei]|uniref:HAD family hydrolase n=1 Tax=Vibrio mediterranei TaxID=689 RepID=UPI000782DC9D|nr:HAD-IA family hydrolase [Vibrio mediterranei]SBO11126.1 2-deoxyglucose-6-phosphate phosphatase [Vibrio mediterranei]
MTKKSLFVFDMDGVLIESEPFWRKAQIEVLANYGASATIDDCIENTMGKRLDDIAAIWIQMFNLSVDAKVLESEIMQRVVALVEQEGEAIEGIPTLISDLKQRDFRLALASSSAYPIIHAVTEKLAIQDSFDLMLSAEDVPNGKPAPDVYLEVCQRLDVPVEQAFALEDSLTGVKAAVAAQLTTIAIPFENNPVFLIADYVVGSVQDVIAIVDHHAVD